VTPHQQSTDFEISLGEVSAMEARVQIRFHAQTEDQDRVTLRGTLRGPFCETARTLPAEFPFHKTTTIGPPAAEAVVPDPCLWSPDLPHLYHADVEALDGNLVIADYHGQIGLRSTTPIRVHE
jgi:beta-galactosidase/beta-glucuronidase